MYKNVSGVKGMRPLEPAMNGKKIYWRHVFWFVESRHTVVILKKFYIHDIWYTAIILKIWI